MCDVTEPPQRKLLFENILFLEVFAGTSVLTVEVRKANLRGVAIDRSKERAKGPLTLLDLTLEEDISYLEEFIKQESRNICLIHFAPLCGTCSAARKRKLPAKIAATLHQAGDHLSRSGQKLSQWGSQVSLG